MLLKMRDSTCIANLITKRRKVSQPNIKEVHHPKKKLALETYRNM